MRNIYRKLEMDAKNIMEGKGEIFNREGQSSSHQQDMERRKTMLMNNGVGELEEIGEFGLGIAPSLSRPINKIEISKKREEEINKMQADDDEPRPQNQEDEDDPEAEIQQLRLKQQKAGKRKPIDRNAAFIEFKALPEGGKTYEDQIISNRQDLKEHKNQVRQITDTCNLAKKELDLIKSKLDAKAEEKRLTMREDMMGYDDDEGGMQGEGTVHQDIIDEEELALIQKMKELKKLYRSNFEKLKEVKGKVFYI